jgi:hypothetical protein
VNQLRIKFLTKEHRENIGKAVKKRGGTPHTDETKVKLSKAMTGKKNPKHSDFMVKNNPKSQKVSIDGVIYDTIKEASEELKINRSTIKYRLNNKKNKTWFKIN